MIEMMILMVVVVLELYLDTDCPFAGISFTTLHYSMTIIYVQRVDRMVDEQFCNNYGDKEVSYVDNHDIICVS